MNTGTLISRQIEHNDNLPAGSYIPIGIILNTPFIRILDEWQQYKTLDFIDMESLDTVIVEGNVSFVYSAFNDNPAYYSKPVENPTIVDIQKALDCGLSSTEDKRVNYLDSLLVLTDLTGYCKMALIENLPEQTKDVIYVVLETGSKE
jgi:hypothetical protein